MQPLPPPPPPFTEEDLPALVKQLEVTLKEVRLNALQKLWDSTISAAVAEILTAAASDSATHPAAGLILKVFQSDSDLDVRIKAAEVLHYKLPHTLEATMALLAALNESDELIRHKIAILMPTESCYVPELAKALANDDPTVRRGIAYAITLAYSRGPHDANITKTLITALSDTDSVVRLHAANALGKYENEGATAEQALTNTLKDADRTVAFAAAKALLRTNSDHKEANRVFDEHIEAALADSDEKVRWSALCELSAAKSVNAKYAEPVIKLLDGTDGDQYMALKALEKIGPAASQAIPNLKRFLVSKTRVRETAQTLAALQPQDPEIYDILARMFLASYPHNVALVHCAAEGLALFGKEAVPFLIKGLDWDKGIVHISAVNALSHVGKDAIEAVPDLLKIIDDGGGQPAARHCHDTEFRSAVLDALASIGPDDERVLERLGSIAADIKDGRNNAAIAALKTIASQRALDIANRPPESSGPPAQTKEEKELIANLQSQSAEKKLKALERLQKFLPSSAHLFTNHVINLLEHDPDLNVRIKAAQFAASSLPDTPATAKALLTALSNPDERFRQAVAAVIPTQVVRGFFISLGSTRGPIRNIAVNALEGLGDGSVALLVKALPTGGADDAALILSKIGNNARAAVPALLRQVHEGHAMFKLGGDGRSDVLDALAEIAPDDERVLECLADLATQKQSNPKDVPTPMAKAAFAALKAIGTERALQIVRKNESGIQEVR